NTREKSSHFCDDCRTVTDNELQSKRNSLRLDKDLNKSINLVGQY
ncbi:MAG: hypothetical protein ACI9U5_001746, partial [Colwellia sp.]